MNQNTEENGLLERWCGKQAGSIGSATHGRNDLSSSTVNGIGMQLPKKKQMKQVHICEQKCKPTVTSSTFTRTPRIFSSQVTPSFVAHWNAATQESLISLRYCTPFVTSTNKLGPVVSGPKHQIFLASVTSQPNSSARTRARSLKSSRELTLPASIAFVSSSSRGKAFT